jgi:uncharacterized membrane protein YqaE (UPF0057 family)
MLINEDNTSVQSLISDIDKNADIIRKNQLLKDYSDIEKELVEVYQNLILPFIEKYIVVGIEIEPSEEEKVINSLLELLKYLLTIIKASKD